MLENLTNLKNILLSKIGFTPSGVDPSMDPQSIRTQQISKISMGIAAGLFGIFYLFSSKAKDVDQGSNTQSSQQVSTQTKPIEKSPLDMATPLTSVDEKVSWVASVEKKANQMREDNNRMKEENQFLQKRLDNIEEYVESIKINSLKGIPNPMQGISPEKKEGGGGDSQPVLKTNIKTQAQVVSSGQPQHYPPLGADLYGSSDGYNPGIGGQIDQNGNAKSMRKPGPKIAFLGGGRMGGGGYKNASMYIPAGTHSKAVIMSGVAASTSSAAQGNPQPMLMRLVDEGNLPRGFKSRVKDAVLTGACYGDISSERVLCRLEMMSWVEKDGSVAEKKVEGWVYGEDGRAGLRGEVVDRAGEVVRESFGAGILSAISNFIKFEATSSVYPASPFGVTNALSGKDVAQGAVASGAGNAFDKLADFSIKRAEQMQPVIMVSAGRVVDVVFKAGFDLSTESGAEMKVVGSNKNTENSNDSFEG